jgi:hypothetical protein
MVKDMQLAQRMRGDHNRSYVMASAAGALAGVRH